MSASNACLAQLKFIYEGDRIACTPTQYTMPVIVSEFIISLDGVVRQEKAAIHGA